MTFEGGEGTPISAHQKNSLVDDKMLLTRIVPLRALSNTLRPRLLTTKHTHNKMSHTKQKKSKHANKTIRTKRKIIEDDDGWAHVIGGRTIQSGKTKTVKTKQGFDI